MQCSYNRELKLRRLDTNNYKCLIATVILFVGWLAHSLIFIHNPVGVLLLSVLRPKIFMK